MSNKRTTNVAIYSWSFTLTDQIVFSGREWEALAGRLVSVRLQMDHLTSEERYELGKQLIDFGARVVAEQEQLWNEAAQPHLPF